MGKLPSPIPGNVYRHTEHRLRHRSAILKRALQGLSQAEADAGAIGSPGAGNAGGGKGGVSDRVGEQAVRLAEARNRVTRAQAWIKVYRWTMDVFRGTDAWDAVRLLFDRQLTQAETARRLSRDRQTVRRYKDEFIIRAAFLAVSWGLIRMNEGGSITAEADESAGETRRVLEENNGDAGGRSFERDERSMR